MDKRPVLFLDSGIGGIPYCRHFYRRNPKETIYYLADRENFPYGPRTREEVAAILTALMEKLIKTVNPKIAVLACNAATVSALAELRQRFPDLPLVGTVPAIKPAMMACKTGKVGVLGTRRTVEDPYIRQLAGSACEVVGIAAPDLVDFVERRFATAGESEKIKIVREYVGRFRAAGTDTLVLGCTHFLFLLEEFHREAAPGIKIFESTDGITRRIESLLDDNGGALRAENSAAVQNRFLITGAHPADSSWENWAGYLGFRLSLLDET